MTNEQSANFRKALGARILSEANDLKRTREALASELGLAQSLVDAVIDGSAALDQAQNLVRAMSETYPIALSDLWLEPDDTSDGAVIMRADASRATSRVFERKDRTGDLKPYYEYRDTAMSRTGAFKPEWIKELQVVENADPDNPDVAFNNGHLMHQQTFFVGEVNFYWSIGGKKYCAELNTGDSNYITPFVPHSFASRNSEAPGLIIAVTFGGEVRRALDDFSRLDAALADSLAGDLRDLDAAYRTRLGRYLSAGSLTTEELTGRLINLGLEEMRANALASGGRPASNDEFRQLADALDVRPEDLALTGLEQSEEVVLRYAQDSAYRAWPDSNNVACRLGELARTQHLPDLKGFAVEVLVNSLDAPAFHHHLFEYIYNYGDAPVGLYWSTDREDILEPGDSACLRPMVAHRFSRPEGAGTGRLCIVRVPGALNNQSLDEFARFATDGRRRVSGETSQWF
jgi:hypothetical protein